MGSIGEAVVRRGRCNVGHHSIIVNYVIIKW